MRFRVAIEEVAAVTLGGENGDQFADGLERCGFHLGYRLPHCDR
jgi:hypothetical protein